MICHRYNSSIPGYYGLGYLTNCPVCKRKILVSLVMHGVPHHLQPSVTCADCIVIRQEYEQENPEQAQELREWIGVKE